MFPQIDKIVVEWCTTCLSKGAVITGPLLRMQAKRVAEKLGVTDFSASKGWEQRFRKRNAIIFRTRRGEAADAV